MSKYVCGRCVGSLIVNEVYFDYGAGPERVASNVGRGIVPIECRSCGHRFRYVFKRWTPDPNLTIMNNAIFYARVNGDDDG